MTLTITVAPDAGGTKVSFVPSDVSVAPWSNTYRTVDTFRAIEQAVHELRDSSTGSSRDQARGSWTAGRDGTIVLVLGEVFLLK